MPHVQSIAARRHVVDREAAVSPGLRVVPVRHDLHVGDHARMHVAVHARESRIRERMALGVTAAIQAEVELIRLADREDVVIEGIVIRKAHRRSDGDDNDVGRVRLVRNGDFDRNRCDRCRGASLEIQHRIAEIGRRLVVFLKNYDSAGHVRPAYRGTLDGAEYQQECQW